MLFSLSKVLVMSMLTAHLAIARAAIAQSSNGKGYSLRTVYQFGNGSWIENMAIRSNGHILATDLVKGIVYDVDPHSRSAPPVVAVFPKGSTPTGATEVEPDVFYIGNSQGDAARLQFTPGTSTLWKIDMNTYIKGERNATLSQILEIPPAKMLNGIVTVNAKAGIILVTDSIGGTIYSVNVHIPRFDLALDHKLLKPDPTARPAFGVNGLRIRGSSLYFCNTNYGYLGTFPVSKLGQITPNPTLITSSVPAADDFDVDDQGNVWLAENVQNTLVRVKPSGQIDVIAGGGNSQDLPGPVSARFGRCADKRILYVSTDGLSFDEQMNPITNAGKIAKIEVGKWAY